MNNIDALNITDEQLTEMLSKMTEEDKDDHIRFLTSMMKWNEELKKCIADMSNTVINIQDKQISENEITITKLLERLKDKDLELLDKESIMKIFNCQSDKALKILKLMHVNNFGCKIGKEYYCTKNEFSKFMNSYKGKSLLI